MNGFVFGKEVGWALCAPIPPPWLPPAAGAQPERSREGGEQGYEHFEQGAEIESRLFGFHLTGF